MILRSHWKPIQESEFVTDSSGQKYEIATFEGKRTLHREVRASVFVRGGSWQFAVDAEAELSQLDAAYKAARDEARRRVREGDWEPGDIYPLP